ncbi:MULTISPECIES: sugar transferase [Jonquetella]|uniref:Glycosyl transferase possibly involved in lipopolysaccharide synthesis n=1 Tax=Jonquetella anthropi DSM 22815 TaxID=885272 RepID=H0ULC3_9BACT|nr:MULTISPECIES: sugar transferase [Jonquetella]EHM13482.1 glycosyl transferase possibly involved in lipopolysaccharide synthesis [Jonquetella anthropi DSM 22815]ERL24492.1 sugar transferase [Jonquetella sp. BV3C21]
MTSKRFMDLLFTIPGIILLSPIMLVIAVWIKCDSKGPIIYKQKRVGLGERLFNVYKFRSMVTDADKASLLTVRADDRVTRAGRFLRKTKLDELPQLFNVLIGNMSLVGPRPEVAKYVAFYPPEAKKLIFSVKPGITERASVEYKDENDLLDCADDPEKTYIEKILPVKIRYSVAYAKSHTVLDDLKIIMATIKAIVS